MESWVIDVPVVPTALAVVFDFVNLLLTATRPIKEEEEDSRPCEEGEDERTTGDENANANLEILSSTAHKRAADKTIDRIDTVLAILKILN